MGLQALGQRADPETQADLTGHARHGGTGPTLIEWLKTRNDPLLDRTDMAALQRLTQDPEAGTLVPLPSAQDETDLIRVAREPDQHALRIEGFHAPEDGGIWTARAQASIRALSEPDHPVTRLAGGARPSLTPACAAAPRNLTGNCPCPASAARCAST